MFQTEFTFTLPKGYVDRDGNLHKEGTMRLANAADEILPLKDPRVQQNPGYLTIIILARVITKLGTLPAVDTRIVEGLFTPDLAYLQDLYQRINAMEIPVYKGICPHCGKEIDIPVNFTEWGREEILSLSHLERIRWCGEISKINRKLNDEPEPSLLLP